MTHDQDAPESAPEHCFMVVHSAASREEVEAALASFEADFDEQCKKLFLMARQDGLSRTVSADMLEDMEEDMKDNRKPESLRRTIYNWAKLRPSDEPVTWKRRDTALLVVTVIVFALIALHELRVI